MPSGIEILAQVDWIPAAVPARGVLFNTLVLVFGTAAISLPIGTFLALLIARTDLPGRKAVALLLVGLLLVPLYLQCGAWQAGFGLQGWYTLLAGGPELVYGMRGAIWVHAMAAIPWVALIVATGLRLGEGNLEEEALLYAGTARVFRVVVLRRAAGPVLVALLWIAVSVTGEMTATDLFRVRTFAEEIYIAHAATGDMNAAALQTLPSITVAAVLFTCAVLLATRLMSPIRRISFRPLRDYALGGWRWPAAGLVVCVVAVMFGMPLVNLVYKAGVYVTTAGDGQFVRSWHWTKMLDMTFVQPPTQFGSEFRASLAVGVISATAALATAVLLAGVAGAGRGQAIAVCGLVAVLLAVPGPVLGVLVIRILGPFPQVYDSYVAPSMAIWLRSLPLATLIVWHALRTVPRDLLETAELDGAGRLARLWLVAIPAKWPAMLAAWLVAFLVALGDLAASQLVLVPGKETLANRVFDRLHSGAYDQVSGLFLCLLLIFGAAAVLIAMLSARLRTQSPRQDMTGDVV